MATDAYRSPSEEPQFICQVCYAHTAPTAQNCPQCSCPMRALRDDDIQAELRSRAKKKKDRINNGRLRVIGFSSFALAWVLNFLLLWYRVYDFNGGHTPHQFSGSMYVFLFLVPLAGSIPLMMLFDFVFKKLRLFEAVATIDPVSASTTDLIRFLEIGR